MLVHLPVPVGRAVHIRVAGPEGLIRREVVVDTSVAAGRVAAATCPGVAVDTSAVVEAVTADGGFGLFF